MQTNSLEQVGPAFLSMAHQIVWCSVASIDANNRPRSRVLHPIWEWDGEELTGWIATGPTPTKRAHLEVSSHLSCNYWSPTHDTCVAECEASWAFDDETRSLVWEKFKNAPEPVGYDPAIIPAWDSPLSDSFAVLTLKPWRLRVMDGSLMMTGQGNLQSWQASSSE